MTREEIIAETREEPMRGMFELKSPISKYKGIPKTTPQVLDDIFDDIWVIKSPIHREIFNGYKRIKKRTHVTGVV